MEIFSFYVFRKFRVNTKHFQLQGFSDSVAFSALTLLDGSIGYRDLSLTI